MRYMRWAYTWFTLYPVTLVYLGGVASLVVCHHGLIGFTALVVTFTGFTLIVLMVALLREVDAVRQIMADHEEHHQEQDST